jgi:hypothetical protein
MKKDFPGWFPKTVAQLDEIWGKAIFVPDTNILLHCIRHEAGPRAQMIKALEILKDRLWIPYQVGLEFLRNRLNVEATAESAYTALEGDYNKVTNELKDKVRQIRAHPMISVEREVAAIEEFSANFKKRIEDARSNHPTKEIEASFEKVVELLEGRVGSRWDTDRMDKLKKEGEDRYTKKIPPGFRDSKKDEADKYGDLIIWKDMIEKAKESSTPIIFITDDAKEDWWWISQGQKRGVRPELVEEFKTMAGQDFYLYEFKQFLRLAAERYPDMRAGLEQAEKSLSEDETARRLSQQLKDAQEAQSTLAALIDEKETVMSLLAGIPSSTRKLLAMHERDTLRAKLGEINLQISSLTTAVEEDAAPSSEIATDANE